ncbi:hypothetical protein SRB17_19780 [Streptomyces sp. RB17]|uniref:hypothetical protein n=1 Tax=Streptomyces sp. RB17 TaxID=2585197 RepID=UPI0012959BA6|nr:hypothetical protein [Streptomyces sp. RB17]MQY34012.1 hypothetical protein [Streptomyces sp. RB17]
MVSAAHAAHDVEVTAESLQEECARLQIQKQALERELAAVVAHLSSVQRALGALETLMRAPATASQSHAPTPVARKAGLSTAEAVDTATVSVPPARRPRGNDGEPPAEFDAGADGTKKYGKLTEQIMEYFASVGDADVRARDVAAALGRDSDSGSINAVRSTLDRLVGGSRIQRAGRGLYRARRS